MKKKEYKKKLAREKAQKVNFNFNEKDDTMKVVKIFVGVILFIFVMFVVTKFITGEWSFSSKKDESNTEEEITNKIICGNILSVDESSAYYVLMYDFKGDDAKLYEIIKTNYESSTSKKDLYIVDLGNTLNKSCLTEDKVNIVNNVSDLKVSDPTLLKVQSKKIVDSKIGKEAIKKYFNSL